MSQRIAMLVLLILASLLVGCNTNTLQTRYRARTAPPVFAPRDLDPLLDINGQARSLTMDSPQHHSLAASATNVDPQPWYVSRNDLFPSVAYGVSYQVYEQSVTYQRDRQRTSNGRVHDHFNQTTYRRRVIETQR